jgi:FKBP-type peptidyl-prolyl cis-trans isomerase
MNHPFLRIALIVVIAASALPALHAQRERLTPQEIEYVDKNWPGTKKTGTGIRYKILKEGTGAKPHEGDRVAMLYRGTLLDGKVFDSRKDPKEPLVFRLGREEVIEGWDQVIPMMTVGEKRVVIIPSSLGYGSRGKAPVIPRDAPLVFEMELIAINP